MAESSCFYKAVKAMSEPPTGRKWGPEVKNWQKNAAVRRAHFHGVGIALRDAIAFDPARHPVKRGIVIAGGGDYIVCAYVSAKMCQHYSPGMPIQLWYLGRNGEVTEAQRKVFKAIGVHCVDADRVAEVLPPVGKPRILNGFELKSFAVAWSPFREVCLIDSDCYPVADIGKLFDSKPFKERGAIFFPDLAQTNSWTNWEMCHIAPHGPKCGWETGQYLINKRRHWDAITFARYYDDHSDFYYGGGVTNDHGDKGSWRLGFAYLKREPHFFHTVPEWRKVAFIQRGEGDVPLFVHRCRDKFRKNGKRFATTPQNKSNVRYLEVLPEEERAHGYYQEALKVL